MYMKIPFYENGFTSSVRSTLENGCKNQYQRYNNVFLFHLPKLFPLPIEDISVSFPLCDSALVGEGPKVGF